ncbi:hypothetical protein FOA52_008960 [Chlamydomonas sp. UWO 241]|nr:hypothetical protein FOA52_008960 [Chlamydomonas sp. UWO 241]
MWRMLCLMLLSTCLLAATAVVTSIECTVAVCRRDRERLQYILRDSLNLCLKICLNVCVQLLATIVVCLMTARSALYALCLAPCNAFQRQKQGSTGAASSVVYKHMRSIITAALVMFCHAAIAFAATAETAITAIAATNVPIVAAIAIAAMIKTAIANATIPIKEETTETMAPKKMQCKDASAVIAAGIVARTHGASLTDAPVQRQDTAATPFIFTIKGLVMKLPCAIFSFAAPPAFITIKIEELVVMVPPCTNFSTAAALAFITIKIKGLVVMVSFASSSPVAAPSCITIKVEEFVVMVPCADFFPAAAPAPSMLAPRANLSPIATLSCIAINIKDLVVMVPYANVSLDAAPALSMLVPRDIFSPATAPYPFINKKLAMLVLCAKLPPAAAPAPFIMMKELKELAIIMPRTNFSPAAAAAPFIIKEPAPMILAIGSVQRTDTTTAADADAAPNPFVNKKLAMLVLCAKLPPAAAPAPFNMMKEPKELAVIVPRTNFSPAAAAAPYIIKEPAPVVLAIESVQHNAATSAAADNAADDTECAFIAGLTARIFANVPAHTNDASPTDVPVQRKGTTTATRLCVRMFVDASSTEQTTPNSCSGGTAGVQDLFLESQTDDVQRKDATTATAADAADDTERAFIAGLTARMFANVTAHTDNASLTDVPVQRKGTTTARLCVHMFVDAASTLESSSSGAAGMQALFLESQMAAQAGARTSDASCHHSLQLRPAVKARTYADVVSGCNAVVLVAA